MPKIFVLRNRLQEQQAKLLENQKGRSSPSTSSSGVVDIKRSDDNEPVTLIVDKKSDTFKDKCTAALLQHHQQGKQKHFISSHNID